MKPWYKTYCMKLYINYSKVPNFVSNISICVDKEMFERKILFSKF